MRKYLIIMFLMGQGFASCLSTIGEGIGIGLITDGMGDAGALVDDGDDAEDIANCL